MPDERKSILFVDDDSHVLAGLARVLRSHRDRWCVRFAEGSKEAFAALATEAFDVVVTDMRMPGGEGAELLSIVQSKQPEAARIVLSGETHQEGVLRVVPLAHRFLTKPCAIGDLIEAIERACAAQRLLQQTSLRRKVGEIDALPVAPQIYVQLNAALADANSSAADIAGIVESDPGLSAKVLQVVNSSFFGLARSISSITEAISYLGVGMVRNLAVSVGILRQIDTSRMPDCFSVEAEHAHGILTGRLAAKLAPRECVEDAFTAGVLHDLGNLIVATKLPEDFVRARNAARETARPLHQVEREMNGYCHGEVGAYLLGLWGLRQTVVEAVAHHHAPSAIQTRTFDAVGAVHVADLLVQRRGGELDRAYLQQTDTLGKVDEWEALADRMLEAAAAA